MKVIKKTVSAAAVCLLSVFIPFHGAVTANAYETVNAKIPVTCLDFPYEDDHTYEIKIESENDSFPVPASDLLTISDNGTRYFEIDITEPGTFSYKVYEMAGNDTDIVYDDNTYIVTVFVENAADDKLIYSVTVNADGKDTKSETIKFHDDTVLNRNIKILNQTDDTVTEVNNTTSAATATVTSSTASTAAATAAAGDNTDKSVTGFIGSVFTGDSFPAHTVRTLLLLSIFAAIVSFLFKRGNREEEDKNEV